MHFDQNALAELLPCPRSGARMYYIQGLRTPPSFVKERIAPVVTGGVRTERHELENGFANQVVSSKLWTYSAQLFAARAI